MKKISLCHRRLLCCEDDVTIDDVIKSYSVKYIWFPGQWGGSLLPTQGGLASYRSLFSVIVWNFM